MHCADMHMPAVTLRTAAVLTGKDRSTLLRAIEHGKLSAMKSELGRYLVDPAELERVYGALRMPPVHSEAPRQDALSGDGLLAAREVEHLRELLERERSERERERHSYERDRQTWEEERTFLRTITERQSEQVRLLTDQREHVPARSPSLWARLFRINA
jgi:hypothetical protein